MKKFLRFIFIIGLLTVTFGASYAQRRDLKVQRRPLNRYHQHHLMYINNIRLTGMVGLSSYYGDLCDQGVCFRYRPGFTLGGYYRYNGRISFRGDLTFLRMAGNDHDGDNQVRNLSFTSSNFEGAVGIMYDLVYFDRNYHLRAKLTPYLFAEIGLLYYNPKAKYNGQNVALRPLMTEGVKYGKFTPSIPLGGGVRYQINDFMDLSVELAYRKTFTDYLDDVSTTYKDNTSFTDPVAAALADRSMEGGYTTGHWEAGHKRGNPNRKDGYFIFGLKFEYMIKTTQQRNSFNSMPRFRHRFPGMHRKYK